MTENSIIIFELDDDLRVYLSSDLVKHEQPPTLFTQIIRSQKILNLSESFEQIWKDLDSAGHLSGTKQIYLFTGPDAGFTDSRVIFVWLKSWQSFGEGEIFVGPKNYPGNYDKLSKQARGAALHKLQTNPNQSKLTYSRDPRIGHK
jgi:hypothetical protein